MHTIAIVNQKGGCGKTTTAINLAGVFAGRGHRTLLVDMDPQSHCAAGLAIPENRIDLHIGDALLADPESPVDPTRLLWRVSRNLDLAPSTLRLAALEAARGELTGKADAEKRLAGVLSRFKTQYDVCLIDCSPAIGILAFNALVACDEVLIPVETGFFSLQGATKQVNTIKAIGKRLGVAPVHRVLATMHEPASVLSKDLLEELRRRFASRLIPVVIRFDQSLRESASFGQPVVEYSAESQGASDYRDLADWLTHNSLRPGVHAAERDLEELASPPLTAAQSAAPVPIIAEPATPLPASRAADVASKARKLAAKSMDGEGIVDAPSSTPTTGSMVEIKEIEPPTPASPVAAPATVPAPKSEISRRTPIREPLPAQAPPPVPTAAPIATAFGPQATSHGIIFRLPASIGRQVAVAGDFNGWIPDRTPMRWNEHNGMLEAMAFMPPGSTSQYRLVVDGQWIADPYNPAILPNPFGGTNSVVSVPSSPAPDVVVAGQHHLSRSPA
ncbi:MAG: AAA family ATPase [Phycisphaerales bacterium]|nr:AAA family ATPase [Phycisphaerales bacterium]